MKYFCCGDVHSFYTPFKEELDKKGFDINNPEHILILCGDLFDRGGESVELFNFVKSIPQDRFIYVRGNHEDLLSSCIDEMEHYVIPSEHHFHNGTVNTVLQFCNMTEQDLWDLYYSYRRKYNIDPILEDEFPKVEAPFKEKMSPILNFIDKNCINYYEVGDYIFVHGWIPTKSNFSLMTQSYRYNHLKLDNWREATEAQWIGARWYNGMEAWKQGIREPDKTIVCGHWHCSWGNSHIHKDCKEWPSKNRVNWRKSFKPFKDEGIIALDGCTAYSGIVNIEVIEI